MKLSWTAQVKLLSRVEPESSYDGVDEDRGLGMTLAEIRLSLKHCRYYLVYVGDCLVCYKLKEVWG